MNFKKIEEIIDIFTKADVKSINIEDKETKIFLQKNKKQVVLEAVVPIAPVFEEPKEVAPSYITLKSDQVGFFHKKDQENAIVKKGKTIYSLTSMKLEHEKKHTKDCKILKFLVEDGIPVEYGQEIVQITEL